MSGKLAFKRLLNASMTLEIARETSNKKPRLTMMENDKNRVLINCQNPFCGFALKPQMVLMESWISANTAVALNSSVTMPITAAKVSLPLSDAFFMIV